MNLQLTPDMTQKQKEDRIKLVFFMILFANVVYLGVCEWLIRYYFDPVNPGFSRMEAGLFSKLKMILYAWACIEMVFILLVKLSLVTDNISGPAVFAFKKLKEGSGTAESVMSFSIFMWVLCESVAIYGLFLFLVQGSRADSYPLVVTGIILLLMFYPGNRQYEKLEKIKKQLAEGSL